jgi:hypothetical protein
MTRSEFLRGAATAALVTLSAPFARATAPQDSSARPENQNLTPEQRMQRRYPQPVKVGFLMGLPVLDDQDRTYGYIREVVRNAEGKIALVVPYRDWFGWAPFDWGRKAVAVPIETVAILAHQVAALDFPRELFAAAPAYAGGSTALLADETVKIAIYRR